MLLKLSDGNPNILVIKCFDEAMAITGVTRELLVKRKLRKPAQESYICRFSVGELVVTS